MACLIIQHQYSTTEKDTASPRKNFKLRNRGKKARESKLSSDQEKTCSSDEESEIIDYIRNLKLRGISQGKVRSRQLQETTRTDNKVQESKEDEVMFERDVVLKKEDIAEAEITQPRGNRVVKSTEQSGDDKDHGSVNKTIALVRYNKNSGRRECSDGHLGNRRNNQCG